MADSGIRGLRHLALKVTDLARSRKFYEEFFGMQVVWEPDPENVYLSSGRDNLALHQIPSAEVSRYRSAKDQLLDHLGFIMDSPASVDRLFTQAELVELAAADEAGAVGFDEEEADAAVRRLRVGILLATTMKRSLIWPLEMKVFAPFRT